MAAAQARRLGEDDRLNIKVNAAWLLLLDGLKLLIY